MSLARLATDIASVISDIDAIQKDNMAMESNLKMRNIR